LKFHRIFCGLVIFAAVVFIGWFILAWWSMHSLFPPVVKEQFVQRISGNAVIFRFESIRQPDILDCYIFDEITKKQLAHFSMGRSPAVILIDSPELVCYDVNDGIIFKVGTGEYQGIKYIHLAAIYPKDNPDLIIVAKTLTSSNEWRWAKRFGEFLIRAARSEYEKNF